MEMMIDFLAKNNERQYNWSKLAEECLELGEVAIKMAHKEGSGKSPTMDHFIEEAGDVILRLDVIFRVLNIPRDMAEVLIDKRIQEKIAKFETYKGKYKNI